MVRVSAPAMMPSTLLLVVEALPIFSCAVAGQARTAINQTKANAHRRALSPLRIPVPGRGRRADIRDPSEKFAKSLTRKKATAGA
jgi:hypothetical protein